MQHYRSTRTGRIVEMHDAKERRAELQQVRRGNKPLDEGLIELEVKRHKRILDKMEDSYVWEKVSAAEAEEATGEPATAAPAKKAAAKKAPAAKAPAPGDEGKGDGQDATD